MGRGGEEGKTETAQVLTAASGEAVAGGPLAGGRGLECGRRQWGVSGGREQQQTVQKNKKVEAENSRNLWGTDPRCWQARREDLKIHRRLWGPGSWAPGCCTCSGPQGEASGFVLIRQHLAAAAAEFHHTWWCVCTFKKIKELYRRVTRLDRYLSDSKVPHPNVTYVKNIFTAPEVSPRDLPSFQGTSKDCDPAAVQKGRVGR